MALLNHAKKELSAKIVYYGPGLSGKTTNLEWIHRKLAPDKRGKLISLETKTDRTLFFDFLPVQIGEISGFRTRFNVYTVPGQIFYNETRRMVLKGVDGIVFVADSQKEMANENLENLKNLAENLRSIGKELSKIPLVIQFNKRDLPNILSVEEMNRLLNAPGLPYFEAVAVKGEGVLTTLTRITRVVADHLKQTLFSSPISGASDGPPEYAPMQEAGGELTASSKPSTIQPSKSATPAFLARQSERSDPSEATRSSEPKRVSRHKDVTPPASIDSFEQSGLPKTIPATASVGASAVQALRSEEIPSLGDLLEPHEARLPPRETHPAALGQQATPQEAPVPTKAASPQRTAVPEGRFKADSPEAPSKGYLVDPSLVTVSAEQVAAPAGHKGAVLRIGDPVRETGNQVRIPVALRLEDSKELLSFQMVIRVEQDSGASS